MSDDTLALDLRDGLPEALLVLSRQWPRGVWEENPAFEGLVRFWLERHAMFRQIIAALGHEVEAMADGRADPERGAAIVARYGNALVSQLHGHHGIEDAHYFPMLAAAEPSLARGFEILDRDHHDLDRHLAEFVTGANAVIRARGARPAAGAFADEISRLSRFLERHLTDEEDLVVPVILSHGPGRFG